MPIYEKIFDIPYPLPKLDTLVASDFDAGAMENWGLITGRTSVYLFDEKKSGIAARKRVIGVQSHEVAHQVRFLFLFYIRPSPDEPSFAPQWFG